MTEGNGQLRAFVERVLRMKEEARAINDDIREIYAEAKANGYDKTVLGQVVSFVAKREKNPDLIAEQSELFDLYLTAFEGGSETGTVDALTHTHEDDGLAGPANAADERTANTKPAPIFQPAHPAAGSSGETPEQTGAVARALDAAPVIPFTAADNARKLRPFCLHTDDLTKCAGVGKKHCFACQKAHADEAGEAA